MTQIIITAISIRTFGCLDCITYIVSFTKALFNERLKIKNLPGCIHIVKFPLKSRNGTIAMFKNIIHMTPVAFCCRRWVIANLCKGFFEIFVAHFGLSFTCVSISATTTVVYSINIIHFHKKQVHYLIIVLRHCLSIVGPNAKTRGNASMCGCNDLNKCSFLYTADHL